MDFFFRRFNVTKYEEGELVSEEQLTIRLNEQRNQECYISHFSYPEQALYYFQNNVKGNGKCSIAGYQESVFADRLYIDIDSDSDEVALRNCRAILRELLSLGFRHDDLDAWFSGRRGFHIGFSTAPWALDPGVYFNRWSKEICCKIAENAKVQIDLSIYSKTSLLRAPYSQHPQTGLYKNPIPVERIFEYQVTDREIIEICRFPIAWKALPNPTVPSINLRAQFEEIHKKKQLTNGTNTLKEENRYPPFEIDWNGAIAWPYWNETFFKIAVLAKVKGISIQECEANLMLLRDKNDSPEYPKFSDSEISSIVRSVYQRPFSYQVSLKNDPAIKSLIIYPQKDGHRNSGK